MKRPSFQFYHGDWRSNAKLRRCTHAERGIWLEVMCLFADSDEFGMLRWPLMDLAQAAGCKAKDLIGLHAKTVLKGGDSSIAPYIYTPRHAGKDGVPVILIPEQSGPLWYSSRMVRDEYLRSIRGDSTRFTDKPAEQPTDSPKAPKGTPVGDGASSSSSSSENTKSKADTPRGTRLLPDWVLPKAWGEWALVEQPTWVADHVRKIGEKFRDYWIAQPGSKGRKLNWEATWRNWVRNEGAMKVNNFVTPSKQSRIDNYAAQAAAARSDDESRIERDITGEAVRIT